MHLARLQRGKCTKNKSVPPGSADDLAEAVVDILLQHKELMQRPVIVKGNKAIIGRPKDKAEKFLKAK